MPRREFAINYQRIIYQLEMALAGPSRYTSGSEGITEFERDGCYAYIPLDLDHFVYQLSEATKLLKPRKASEKHSFVDVGCGVGTKLLIARQFDLTPHGVEINPHYAKATQAVLCGRSKCDCPESKAITIVDAREHDYSPYDVIYFYCPFNDPAKEWQLEARIIATAHSGAVLMANLKREELWHDTKDLECITDDIFIKR